MSHTISQVCSKLVGTPYEVQDCWGIVKLFYKEAFDIELGHYYDHPPMNKDISRNLIYSNKGEFTQVQSPEVGDLILIRLAGVPCHIGVYLGDGKFIHSWNKQGCIIDRVSRWQKSFEGYYRL